MNGARSVVAFDIGETLIDETRMWERAADVAGVPRFTLMGVLGGLAARGEHHDDVWGILGVEHPAATWGEHDWYPDALPAIEALRQAGHVVWAVGNTPVETEELLRPHVDAVGSAARWGVSKPDPGFFTRLIEEAGVPADKIAYVGDRVDNDILPALAAGLVAVHVRRGPWGLLHEAPAGAISIRSLAELPAVLA
ncbi:MAG TPA: HAD family hydrolase [Gaiellaceae bacterium]|jgi:FMN phosphatase YigB (HAD superfamily)|nr:HAD family hydrolase [Gaiellaceae bacterium]